jgi:hypothetical protein
VNSHRGSAQRLSSVTNRWLAYPLCLAAISALAGGLDRKTADSGIAVSVSVRSLQNEADPSPPREGEAVRVTLRVTDQQTGQPMKGLYPNAWMKLRRGNEATPDRKGCSFKIAALSSGSIFNAAEVDLNVYHVMTLNADASVSVVDPRFSFGGSHLLALVALESPGDDWTLNADSSLLFVSMPEAGKVAVIDTARWKLVRNLAIGPSPRRVVLQPDGHYVWVAYGDDDGERSGIAALTSDGATIAARVETGLGAHDIALSTDSRWALATNSKAGTLSVIDVHKLRKTVDVAAGARPISVAWSTLSRAAYIASDVDGAITVVDPERGKAIAHVRGDKGIYRVRFAPGGRLALLPSPAKNTVQIIDAARNHIIQTADVEKGPFEVTFSSGLAYVRHLGSETVVMIPLPTLGREGAPVSIVDFPGGQHVFGEWTRPTVADGIVGAPGEDAVLVANPADRSVYYYKEGMAAPMGSFSNDGHEPRALLVVDRTLHETAPGVFTTTARLGRPGTYDFAVFVDAPRVMACVEVPVAVDPVLEAARQPAVVIQHLTETRVMRVGEKVTLRFRLTDSGTHQPKEKLADLRALISLASGQWQQRVAPSEAGNGEYRIEFTALQSGIYYLYLECPSAGLKLSNPGVFIFEATEG